MRRGPVRSREDRSCPGIEDEGVRRLLLIHATRFSSHTLLRQDIRSIIMARDTLSGPLAFVDGTDLHGPWTSVLSTKARRRAKARRKARNARASGRARTRRPLRTLMQKRFASTAKDTRSETVGPWRRIKTQEGQPENAVEHPLEEPLSARQRQHESP